MSLSVLTIARGRRNHLTNLLLGLREAVEPPCEVIVGAMQDEPFGDLPDLPFPVRQLLVPGEPAPLARARNATARAAEGDMLAFLDVDCIPAPDLIRDYRRHLACMDALVMGEVLYLPAGAASTGWRYRDFERVAVKHCDRRGPPANAELEPCNDYRCFWSLNFAVRKRTFERTGGFDERYVGYGGEDTDFGRTVREAEVPLLWCRGALAYHQHHPHHMPPVQHLESVLANSELFRRKWGHHTMEHWIYAFQLMGLVRKSRGGYRAVRPPDEADLALTMQRSDQPYTSSSWVVRRLKERLACRGTAASGDLAIAST